MVTAGKERPMARRCLLVFAVIAVASCVGCTGSITAFTYVCRWLDPFEARRLDPEAWAVAEPEGRAAMARDAIRHLPPGLPEEEIQALLGPCSVGDRRGTTASTPADAVRTYQYYLGSWSPTYYDDTFLRVHVGEDGRIIAAVIAGY
jgi:hypothetical protein